LLHAMAGHPQGSRLSRCQKSRASLLAVAVAATWRARSRARTRWEAARGGPRGNPRATPIASILRRRACSSSPCRFLPGLHSLDRCQQPGKRFRWRHPGSQNYELTDHGRKIAVLFTKTYTRILNPALAELDPTLPDEIAQRSPLARAWRALEKAVDQRIADAALKPS
jgi:hypothetical protein